MLSVTFQGPIIIEASNLHSLLSLTNTPALVEAYSAPVADVAAPVKRNRKPAGSNPAAAAGDKPKRTRATKAEMEARRAAAGGGAPEEPVKSTVAPEAGASETPASPEQSATTTAAPVTEKPKRDRRSAAKKAADAAKEAGKVEPAPKKSAPAAKAGKGNGAPVADAAELQDRFAKLIDKSFEDATAALAEFGVKRFSELEADKLGAFGAKLTELGV